VVAIRTNLAAIPEPGFPFVARRAESSEPPRLMVTFVARHLDLQTCAGGTRFDWSEAYQQGMTG
jgi:hypothetical protein